MKIGIIYVGYNTEDYISPSLAPWISVREKGMDGDSFLIAAVSMPFEGFDTGSKDNTQRVLQNCWLAGKIDVLFDGDTPVKETEARGQALKWLVAQGCDITIMVDSDEMFTVEEISRVMAFVGARPLVPVFKGSLRNCVFDEKTYLVEPFRPMRVHRVRVGTYVANSFWDDNNVLYRGTLTRDFKRDIDFPVAQIPRSVQFTRHFTWLNDLRSKRKVEYQLKRWGRCSFAWDDAQGGLIWNPALPIPETARDSS